MFFVKQSFCVCWSTSRPSFHWLEVNVADTRGPLGSLWELEPQNLTGLVRGSQVNSGCSGSGTIKREFCASLVSSSAWKRTNHVPERYQDHSKSEAGGNDVGPVQVVKEENDFLQHCKHVWCISSTQNLHLTGQRREQTKRERWFLSL